MGKLRFVNLFVGDLARSVRRWARDVGPLSLAVSTAALVLAMAVGASTTGLVGPLLPGAPQLALPSFDGGDVVEVPRGMPGPIAVAGDVLSPTFNGLAILGAGATSLAGGAPVFGPLLDGGVGASAAVTGGLVDLVAGGGADAASDNAGRLIAGAIRPGAPVSVGGSGGGSAGGTGGGATSGRPSAPSGGSGPSSPLDGPRQTIDDAVVVAESLVRGFHGEAELRANANAAGPGVKAKSANTPKGPKATPRGHVKAKGKGHTTGKGKGHQKFH